VAVTRAKQKLWITYANARYRFGQLVQNEPSRFLDEMPEEFLDKSYAGGGAKNQGFGNMGTAFERMNRGFSQSGYTDTAQAEKKYGTPPAKKEKPTVLSQIPPVQKVVQHIPTANFEASDITELQAGQRVEHQKFGYGIVAKMEGSAHNPVATINFENSGEKKIMLNYAKLRIIR
jgi:DNA helicase-2/ATP-dependent DNA helicase PcrA